MKLAIGSIVRTDTSRAIQRMEWPRSAVTETFGYLAKRGAGKTYSAMKAAEQMAKAGLRFCYLDPIGVAWGLRSSADGKSDGLPVVIFGGEHGDLPLTDGSGHIVAQVVAAGGPSFVIDLSGFRKGKQRTFVADFLEELYHINREPLHVFLDEADSFAPQHPQKGDERMLGAAEDLVRRGRARGLGVSLITQRSAVVNKDVLTQIETLIVLRTTGPQDRDAIKEWVKHHGDEDQARNLLTGLAELPRGRAWVWSPGWLGGLWLVDIDQRETFDSSATPEVGRVIRTAKRLAPVQLEAIRARMTEVEEEDAANNPAKLKARIIELTRELERKPKVVASEPVIERVEIPTPMIEPETMERLAEAMDAIERVSTAIHQATARLIGETVDIKAGIAAVRNQPAPRPKLAAIKPMHPAHIPQRESATTVPHAPAGATRTPEPARPASGDGEPFDGSLAKAERTILQALASHTDGLSKPRLQLITGYKMGAGYMVNTIGKMRSRGLLTPAGVDPIRITDVGIGALGDDYEQLPAPGPELIAWWKEKLPKAQREMLDAFVEAFPGELSSTELAERTGYAKGAGYFVNSLGRIRGLGLVEGWRASPNLMGG